MFLPIKELEVNKLPPNPTFSLRCQLYISFLRDEGFDLGLHQATREEMNDGKEETWNMRVVD